MQQNNLASASSTASSPENYTGPKLVMDSSTIRRQIERFRSALPRVQCHFAMKSNPDSRLLELMHGEDVKFEVASTQELADLEAIGVPLSEVLFSNPIKARSSIIYAHNKGVRWFVLDSIEELHKIHSIAPKAKLYLRTKVSNEGATWQLSGKFGAEPGECEDIINEAVALGADLAGITFHVGSQCIRIENWLEGLEQAKQLFAQMQSKGLKPTLLNLGGGFPVPLDPQASASQCVPDIEQIAQAIESHLKDFPADVHMVAEPGRYLVAEAGTLTTQIIGLASRGDQRWVYIDLGFYNGLIEFKDGLRPPVLSSRTGKAIPWTMAGPTCDGADVITSDQLLPEDLTEGDILEIKTSGAYSNACANSFNGFQTPEVIVI